MQTLSHTLDELNIRSVEFLRNHKIWWPNRDIASVFWFTGWKPEHGDNEGLRGLVAQWVAVRGKKNFYVNIPGMQSGEFLKGTEFDIGTQRLYLTDDWSHVSSVILNGYAAIRALVEVKHG